MEAEIYLPLLSLKELLLLKIDKNPIPYTSRTVSDSGKSDHMCMVYTPHSDQEYEVPKDIITRSLLYSLVLPYFLGVLPQFSGEVAFNTQIQQCEFVNFPVAEADASFVIYHENHNKYYYFTDTRELLSVPLLFFHLVPSLYEVETCIYVYPISFCLLDYKCLP